MTGADRIACESLPSFGGSAEPPLSSAVIVPHIVYRKCYILGVLKATRRIRCGRLVREARRRYGLDQAELARRLGTSQPAISRIERDQVSPTIETLERMLNAMGETLRVSTLALDQPAPGGSNQSIAELRADYRLSVEERLAQAAQLSEIATELAAGAEFR